jgi:hypothetical protein
MCRMHVAGEWRLYPGVYDIVATIVLRPYSCGLNCGHVSLSQNSAASLLWGISGGPYSLQWWLTEECTLHNSDFRQTDFGPTTSNKSHRPTPVYGMNSYQTDRLHNGRMSIIDSFRLCLAQTPTLSGVPYTDCKQFNALEIWRAVPTWSVPCSCCSWRTTKLYRDVRCIMHMRTPT